MRLEARCSPKAIVALALAASYFLFVDLVFVALLSLFAPIPDSFNAWISLWSLGLLVPSGLAVWVSLAAINAIRRGLMDTLWPPPVVAALHDQLASKALVWTSGCLIGAGFLLSLISLALPRTLHHRHMTGWGGLIYFFIAPSMTRTALLKLLAPPCEPGGRTWLQDIKPLASAHWGKQ